MNEAKLKIRFKELLTGLNIYFKAQEIKDDENLFNLGALDSLMLIQFVVSIEDDLKIRLSNEDINYDNFATLNNIAKFIFQNYLKNA